MTMTMPMAAQTLSFELQPPRQPKRAPKFWHTAAELAALQPDFFTITYGAGGHGRNKTAEVASGVLAETGIPVVAHLTAVGATIEGLTALVRQLLAVGVRQFLALRGDPPANLPDWQPGPDEVGSAIELIGLIRRVARDVATGIGGAGQPTRIGVATFPDGNHHAGTTPGQELARLVAKQAAGADFAITQVLFDADGYLRYLAAARAAGVTIPIIPGILPITGFGPLDRAKAMAGVEPPPALLADLTAETAAARYHNGIRYTARLASQVIAGGAPGLHFFTFNKAAPTKEVLNLELARNIACH